MKKYLLIDSQGEFEAADAREFPDVLRSLKASGAQVEMFLVQNGVMPARAGARAPCLADAIGAGIPVMADEFSMRERALGPQALVGGVSAAPIGEVIKRMADGWTVIWR